jgi:hypothetical protein
MLATPSCNLLVGVPPRVIAAVANVIWVIGIHETCRFWREEQQSATSAGMAVDKHKEALDKIIKARAVGRTQTHNDGRSVSRSVKEHVRIVVGG